MELYKKMKSKEKETLFKVLQINPKNWSDSWLVNYFYLKKENSVYTMRAFIYNDYVECYNYNDETLGNEGIHLKIKINDD